MLTFALATLKLASLRSRVSCRYNLPLVNHDAQATTVGPLRFLAKTYLDQRMWE